MPFRYSSVLLLALLSGCDGIRSGRVTHDSIEFNNFMKTQRESAATPDADLVRRGQEVFLHGPCGMCHAIRGTPALSRVGPDLTHFSTRRTLAAGTMANTRGNLAGWILNPQNLKPGTKMPPTLLNSADLHALLEYLSGGSPVESQAASGIVDGRPQQGKVLVGWYGCASCHVIPDAPRAGWVGPPLRGVASRSYLAGRLPNTRENMIRWIRHPRQVDELTIMPEMNVTEQDARDIAAFLYTLR